MYVHLILACKKKTSESESLIYTGCISGCPLYEYFSHPSLSFLFPYVLVEKGIKEQKNAEKTFSIPQLRDLVSLCSAVHV